MAMHVPPRVQKDIDNEERLAGRLADLAMRLEDMPFESRTGSDCEHEMHEVQKAMIRRPPYVYENGIWQRQAEGVHHLTLAERQAQSEPIRSEFIDGVCNADTDLVPTFIVPAEVRMGPRATLTSGKAWAENKWRDRFPVPKFEVRGFKRIPIRFWKDWINHRYALDMERHIKVILNQLQVGSCGAEGTAGCAHLKACMAAIQSIGKAFDVAPQPYFLYNITSGGVYDRGSNPADNIALIQRLGCCTQAIRSRAVGWRAKHTALELADAEKHQAQVFVTFPISDIELLGTMIFNGHPVAAGWPGHWWYTCKILSETMINVVNSWGYGWGKNGIGTLHVSELQYMLAACLTIEDASQLTY